MTPEMAKKWLPIIQAVAEGKVLQIRTVTFHDNLSETQRWQDVPNAALLGPPAGDPESYRIKPDPREFWVVDRGSNLEAFGSWESAGAYCGLRAVKLDRIIHVREVIDE